MQQQGIVNCNISTIQCRKPCRHAIHVSFCEIGIMAFFAMDGWEKDSRIMISGQAILEIEKGDESRRQSCIWIACILLTVGMEHFMFHPWFGQEACCLDEFQFIILHVVTSRQNYCRLFQGDTLPFNEFSQYTTYTCILNW